MGGIGCGKSTYLRLFFNKFKRESVAGRSHVIFLDYLGYSSNLSTLRDFTFTKIANDIKSQPGVVARDVLELMYRDEIQILKTTKLYGITDEARLSEEIGNFLYEELRNPDSFSQKALSSLLIARVLPILVFDNVDQLPLEIQIEIFSMAQYFSRQIGCLSVLALREESYCTARMQKVFTAYTLNKYHLSSPSLKKLIEVRINMALKKLSYDNPTNIHVAGKDVSTHDVANFLKVVHANILEKHKPLFTFIQSLAYGNMRLALSMLNTFMTSGTTDVGKILYKYLHQRDPYKVPFHEFVKSITLGEFRYFKEDRSPVTNIYDVQAAPNSSHFTGIRLLRYLDSRRNNRSPEGQGFVDIHEIVYAFDELFHNLEDIRHTIQKFIVRNKQLVELDTRMTDTISGASYIRITPSGVFYINELYKRFVYLDLVWQDTPFSNPSISQELARQINRLDLEERFRRVEIFLKYLQDEENQEVNKFTLDDALGILAEKVMPTLLKSFRGEIGYIRSHRRVY
jgi:hypothetical protein